MFREEWRAGAARGKKVPEGRCGKTIEAKPLSGQTCLIEPAEGAPATLRGRSMAMDTRTPFDRCSNGSQVKPLRVRIDCRGHLDTELPRRQLL